MLPHRAGAEERAGGGPSQGANGIRALPVLMHTLLEKGNLWVPDSHVSRSLHRRTGAKADPFTRYFCFLELVEFPSLY